MKLLYSFLLTSLIENSPELIDYVFVFWLINEWDKEVQEKKKKIKDILKEGQKDNLKLELKFTEKNLKDLKIKPEPISLNYEKHLSKKINKLVDKSFKKVDKQVKGNILNALNRGDTTEIENILKTLTKKKDITNGVLYNLMRVYRTENTKSRSMLKLEIQEELEKQGIYVRRKWLHTLSNPNNIISESYQPREDHLSMNGVVEDHRGFFHNPSGNVSKGPGLFGLPEEDINCRCDVVFVDK